MLKYADILKIAKDPEDKYHDLRRRFFVDEYTDPGEDLEALPDDLEEKDIESWNNPQLYGNEGKKYRKKWLSRTLAERNKILKQMENMVGWNDDNAPREFGDFLRKIKQMRDNALFLKYLPSKGYLDINKVKNPEHAQALLDALTDEQLNEVTLPTNDYRDEPWKAPRTPLSSPDGTEERDQIYYNYGDLLDGFWGEDIKNRVLSGEIKTFGDWNRVAAKEYKKFPTQARREVKDELKWIKQRRQDREKYGA